MPVVHADGVPAPSDLDKILKTIAQRQEASGGFPAQPSSIVVENDQIILKATQDTPAAISFHAKSPTIAKNFRFKSGDDVYSFVAILERLPDDHYERIVKQINGTDAVVFFNEKEVFVYTQAPGREGTIELKEWIYARAPNTPQGSQWTWVFRSNPWHWPMTMQLKDDGAVAVNRNMPFKGIPIVEQARHQYMLNMMLKFKGGDEVKKYFPFTEEMATIGTTQFRTLEGSIRRADVAVKNLPAVSKKPPQKRGLDFGAWDDYWQSTYTVSVAAKPQEYPLLVEPSGP